MIQHGERGRRGRRGIGRVAVSNYVNLSGVNCEVNAEKSYFQRAVKSTALRRSRRHLSLYRL